MTREDIIRMAREADSGFDGGPNADGTMTDSLVGLDAIERFAALVAAAEREACAQEFDRRDKGFGFYEPNEPAQIIRARGNT